MSAAVREVEPSSYSDLAEVVRDAQQDIWQSQWHLRDMCQQILTFIPPHMHAELLDYIQTEAGISHQKVIRWAEEAELVPWKDRAQDKAPTTQIAEVRKRQKESV